MVSGREATGQAGSLGAVMHIQVSLCCPVAVMQVVEVSSLLKLQGLSGLGPVAKIPRHNQTT